MLIAPAVVLVAPLMLADLPPAFTDMPYEQAIAANAAAEGRLLIVKFTAAWCGPCKVMDRTTWSDDGVVAYLKEHGITVIPVDVDEHEEIARDNRISAMPTMVVYRGGAEFDRKVGGMNAGALTGWLDEVRAGRTRAVALREKAGRRAGPDGRVDVKERLDIARELAAAGDHAGATEEYAWLWENMLDHDESMTGVRTAYLTHVMRDLAGEKPAAMEAFTALRDGLTERLKAGETSRENLTDWLVLNLRVLDDQDAVDAWLDRIWDRPTGKQTVRALSYLLYGWMAERGHWVRLGEVQLPAFGVVFEKRSVRSMMRGVVHQLEDAERVVKLLDERYADELAVYHAACLAAGRDNDAWAAADALLQDLDTPEAREALCRRALQAGAVRERHLELAGPVEGPAGEELRAALGRALSPDA